MSGLERARVLHVADERGQEALNELWVQPSEVQRMKIEAVAMDMWEPYIKSARAHLPGADGKIVFDKFHVAPHLCNAVDQVGRQEHRAGIAGGDPILKGTKHRWLEGPKGRSWLEAREFTLLRKLVTRAREPVRRTVAQPRLRHRHALFRLTCWVSPS